MVLFSWLQLRQKNIIVGFCSSWHRGTTGELTLTFAWLLLALSQVYGSVVMQAVALTTSDGDEKIYKPIDSAIKTKVLGGRRARCIHVCIYVCTYV